MGKIITEFDRALRPTKLHVVDIASTPIKSAGGIILPGGPPPLPISESETKFLKDALALYKRHYVDLDDKGIAGEGETKKVVLSRLRGNDPYVKRVSVIGLADQADHVRGIAFIETYEVQARDKAGIIKPGLVHLCTYAAIDHEIEKKLPDDQYPITAAFNASMIEHLKTIDSQLGYEPGNSIYIGEVNCTHSFEGEKLSDKMDPEFEIKSGAPRGQRGVYTLHGKEPKITPIGGNFGPLSYILDLGKAFYVPPDLGDEKSTSHDLSTPAKEAATLFINKEFKEGVGEPLFLVTSSPYHGKPDGRDIRMTKDFLEKLYISVAHENLGIKDANYVREALKHVPDYVNMQQQLEELAKQRNRGEQAPKHSNPPRFVPAETKLSFEEIGRNARDIGKA